MIDAPTSSHGLLDSAISRLRNTPAKDALYTLLFVYTTWMIYRLFFHPLSKIPGPRVACLTELWRTRRYMLGGWHQDILDLHEKYGPVVRIAPNEISFVDRDALIRVYGHRSGSKKTSWYHTWRIPGRPDSFFNEINPKIHAFKRKRVSATYSMSALSSLEPQIQAVTDLVWERFKGYAATGQLIDLQQWTTYYASDVVCQLGLGKPIGFVASGDDVDGIAHSLHSYFHMVANLGALTGRASSLINSLIMVLGSLLGMNTGGNAFQDWIIAQVQNRKALDPQINRTHDMLDHFLAMKDANGEPADLTEVMVEAANLLGAGGDTTAIGITVILGQLLTHPNDYKRLQEEVDNAFDEHGLDKNGESLDFALANKLPFLSACVKEATRLYPSILWQLPREAPEDGVTIAGYFVPPRTTIGMSPIAQNRCKDIFGEDANEWKPERYIVGEKGTTEEYVRNIEKYNVTFGFGSRTCIGRNLATIEMHKFVGEFVRKFTCELVNKEQPWVRRSFWFCLQEKLLVTLKARNIPSEP